MPPIPCRQPQTTTKPKRGKAASTPKRHRGKDAAKTPRKGNKNQRKKTKKSLGAALILTCLISSAGQLVACASLPYYRAHANADVGSTPPQQESPK